MEENLWEKHRKPVRFIEYNKFRANEVLFEDISDATECRRGTAVSGETGKGRHESKRSSH